VNSLGSVRRSRRSSAKRRFNERYQLVEERDKAFGRIAVHPVAGQPGG
jgi:hypothetical protein